MDKRSTATFIILAVMVSAAVLAYAFLPSESAPSDLTATVNFQLPDGGTKEFTCRVAESLDERTAGLMGVERLPEDEGMLFVLSNPRDVTVWMKDVLIPLDIIFIDENGNVSKVCAADIEPDVPDNLLTRYRSDGDVLWVVEVNLGLCAEYGIGPGAQTDIVVHE